MNGDTSIAILGIAACVSYGMWRALKPRLVARGFDWSEQPTPDVTADDVGRIVRRDFSDARFEDVMAVLTGFRGRWEGQTTRVQLAALKLANGNLDSLRMQIAIAKEDFRDVLVVVEYPEYVKRWRTRLKSRRSLFPSTREPQRIFDADWQQYESWLRR